MANYFSVETELAFISSVHFFQLNKFPGFLIPRYGGRNYRHSRTCSQISDLTLLSIFIEEAVLFFPKKPREIEVN